MAFPFAPWRLDCVRREAHLNVLGHGRLGQGAESLRPSHRAQNRRHDVLLGGHWET